MKTQRQGARTVVYSDLEAVLCSAALKVGGLTLEPDLTKGYVEFALSRAFPCRTAYGFALHPQVIANSWASMLHQVFNIGHLMKAYDPENITRDRNIGSIVAVEFPNAPLGGWKLPTSSEGAPGIRGAAVVHKKAEGVDRIFGGHQTGRKPRTVSMELMWYPDEGGWAVPGAPEDCGLQAGQNGVAYSEDWQAAGHFYVPWASAPKELAACYSKKPCDHVEGKFKGRVPTHLQGGLNGVVHYYGVGLVDRGADPSAEIAQMLAQARPHGLQALAGAVNRAVQVLRDSAFKA